ncbi:MAG: heparan-alpha-glucosaminide N-acetyltransferase domain-containing protein [Eubacteriales bacterium]|nr:heparan-alpha-glucosaminide N-acetyltransferase domain-containing protein [Eubacteriales bacterium]
MSLKAGAIKQAAGRFRRLDQIRGAAVLLMFVHHFCFDLQYLYDVDLGLGRAFFYPLHLLIVCIFIACSAFTAGLSKRQSKRGLWRQIAAAVLLCFLTSLLSLLSGQELYIFWNMLMLIALARLIIYLSQDLKRPLLASWLLSLGAILIASLMTKLYQNSALSQNYPLPAQADYLALWPWLLYFMAIYSWVYFHPPKKLARAENQSKLRFSPLAFLGRHALIFYFVHQGFFILCLEGFTRAKNYFSS